MIAAHSSRGKPPTPVPNAGSASDRQPSSSATSRHRRVVGATSSAFVCRSCPITAPWITWRARRRPPEVATASPTAIGPFATASRSISAPPGRLIAPATPAPIQSSLLAALAIASTFSAVMSPCVSSSCTSRHLLEEEEPLPGRPPVVRPTDDRPGIDLLDVGSVAKPPRRRRALVLDTDLAGLAGVVRLDDLQVLERVLGAF